MTEEEKDRVLKLLRAEYNNIGSLAMAERLYLQLSMLPKDEALYYLSVFIVGAISGNTIASDIESRLKVAGL